MKTNESLLSLLTEMEDALKNPPEYDKRAVIVLLRLGYKLICGEKTGEAKASYADADVLQNIEQVRAALRDPKNEFDYDQVYVTLRTAHKELMT